MKMHTQYLFTPSIRRILYSAIFASAIIFFLLSHAHAFEIHQYPVPETVSPQLQKFFTSKPLLWFWNLHSKNTQELKEIVAKNAALAMDKIAEWKKKMAVQSVPGIMGGVPVFTLTPKEISEAHKGRVLLHIHGGGYVFCPGESGIDEGLLMAALGKYAVVSVDYRMVPDHPYPAALDDVVSVYKHLLTQYPPQNIGIFGSSAGGALTLSLVLRAKAENLPMPAAIAPGSPWSDIDKIGDTYFTHEGQDNVLVLYDGWLKESAKLYANGHDLKDPYISPVYGDVSGFPPTFLTSGTRDLFLSNTVRMHVKLRQAGVPADLMVFEGMSHVIYQSDPSVPEVRFHFAELTKFFDRNFQAAFSNQ